MGKSQPYPSYVYAALRQARIEGTYYLNQDKAAGICFDILTEFPNCQHASELIFEMCCDEWHIYQSRKNIAESVEEFDDRPYRQRERLAKAFHSLTRWPGYYDEDGERMYVDGVPEVLEDVEELLEQGKMQLFVAYCYGHDESADYAWPRFRQGIDEAEDPIEALYWVAEEYADHGYFADAAEVLIELCSRDGEQQLARRLLVEMVWWRDYGPYLPYIPPAGDGSRYQQIAPVMYPERKSNKEELDYLLGRMKIVGTAPTWEPGIKRDVLNLFEDALHKAPPLRRKRIVDWRFLDDMTPNEWLGMVPLESLSEWTQTYAKKLADEGVEGATERSKRYLFDAQRKEFRLSLIPVPESPKLNQRSDSYYYFAGEADADEDDDYEIFGLTADTNLRFVSYDNENLYGEDDWDSELEAEGDDESFELWAAEFEEDDEDETDDGDEGSEGDKRGEHATGDEGKGSPPTGRAPDPGNAPGASAGDAGNPGSKRGFGSNTDLNDNDGDQLVPV